MWCEKLPAVKNVESLKNDIAANEELLELLDDLLEMRGSGWWTKFYSEPNRKCPFFAENPDENLIELIETRKILPSAKALELGCGNGRNSNYLANLGFEVDAVDFSDAAIRIAKENSAKANDSVKYYCQSIFDFDYSDGNYDFIYDSGCFHHIAPHRRPEFFSIIVQALKPGGIFEMVCFAPGGGSDYTDLEVYEKRSMGGGLSFSQESLRKIFSNQFSNIRIRKMKELPENSGVFGKDFRWAVRMEKKNEYLFSEAKQFIELFAKFCLKKKERKMETATIKAVGLASALADEVQEEAATTRKCLERIPAEKFGWKPHEKSMPFGKLSAHSAEMFQWIEWAMTTSEHDFAKEPYQPFAPQTNAELMQFFDNVVNGAVESLRNATDEALSETWTMRDGEKIYFAKSKAQVLRTVILNHIYHHRGQMTVYLRLNDIPVPSIYGPSADDKKV